MKKTLRLLCCICAFSLMESAPLKAAWYNPASWYKGAKNKWNKRQEKKKNKKLDKLDKEFTEAVQQQNLEKAQAVVQKIEKKNPAHAKALKNYLTQEDTRKYFAQKDPQQPVEKSAQNMGDAHTSRATIDPHSSKSISQQTDEAWGNY